MAALVHWRQPTLPSLRDLSCEIIPPAISTQIPAFISRPKLANALFFKALSICRSPRLVSRCRPVRTKVPRAGNGSSSSDKSGDGLQEEDVMIGLNETANEAVRAMLSGRESDMVALLEKLDEYEQFLTSFGHAEAAMFMRIIQGMLDHRILIEVDSLSGEYKKAFNKMAHILQDSGWKLKVPGEEEGGGDMVDEELMPPVFI